MKAISKTFILLAIIHGTSSCRTTNEGQRILYQVKIEQGDTLSGLAQKYDTTWRKIAKLNSLGRRPVIWREQVILIRPGLGGLRATERGLQNSGSGGGAIFAPASRSLPKSAKGIFGQSNKSSRAGKPRGFIFRSKGSAWVWPVKGVITSEFGVRRGKIHTGIDIGAKSGVTIHAAGSGRVEFAGWKTGYGRTVVIDHGSNLTLYAHCSALQVKKNQMVRAGQKIAKVGRSGNATGSHLHFEYQDRYGRAVDPRNILSSRSLSSL